MQVVNFSKREFSKLEPLELPNNIFNTEAEMFLVSEKDKWEERKSVLKKLYIDEGEIFSNKLYTINELLNKKSLIDIEELVMPDALAVVDEQIVGFTMPFVPNVNLQTLLDDKNIPISQKVAYLKEVGKILEKVKRVREYKGVLGFYLNDVHENNFVWNKNTGKINAVDLDSCKIGNNLTAAARYLTTTSQLPYISKYKPLNHSIGGVYEIDDNTENYCYIVMIFNLFFGSNIGRISIPDFYVYLEYLSQIGVSTEFLDKISYIYINKTNENPWEYLEELEPFYGRTHQNVFNLVRSKGFIQK